MHKIGQIEKERDAFTAPCTKQWDLDHMKSA